MGAAIFPLQKGVEPSSGAAVNANGDSSPTDATQSFVQNFEHTGSNEIVWLYRQHINPCWDLEIDYMGLFSSKKKTAETPKLICLSGDAQSYKCIFLAAYRKLAVDVEWESSSAQMAGLDRLPCVEEGDLKVCGPGAALTYLNIKGRSPTIHPRKARVLAAQQYWIQVLTRKLEPLLNDIQNNQAPIAGILKVLDDNLAGSNHIVGEFSLADIHWSATCKALEEQGHGAMLGGFDNIGKWLANMKSEIPQYDAKT